MNAPLALSTFKASKQLHRPDRASTHRVRLYAEDSHDPGSARVLDAEVEFSLFQHPDAVGGIQYLSVWLGSRGGGRNNDYDHAVRALLERAHLCNGEMVRVAVERRRDTRPIEDRILRHAWGSEASLSKAGPDDWNGCEWWREYSGEANVEDLRRTIGRVVALHGRPAGAKGGGNRQKAIRMVFILWSAKVGDLDTMPGVLRAFGAASLPTTTHGSGGSHV